MSARVGIFIALVAGAAASGIAVGTTSSPGADRPLLAAAVLLTTLVLQLHSLELPGLGAVGVSAIGLIAAAVSMGAGAAMTIAVFAALLQWARTRGLLHRAVFDAANFALAAGTAAVVYRLVGGEAPGLGGAIAAGTIAGIAYAVVNNGLLCLVMSIAERRSFVAVWRERFRWALVVFLAFGPAAAAFGVAARHGDAVAVGALFAVAAVLFAALRLSGRARPVATA